jgi:hypothetical protein
VHELSRGLAVGSEMRVTFERVMNWLAACETKRDPWPKFKLVLDEHEWVIYPFFALLVVVFLLLLPRAARFP